METLIKIAEQEGINLIENAPLPESFLGLYYSAPKHIPLIFLSKEIYGQRKLERCVLAEELGHHFTTPQGDYLPRKNSDSETKAKIDKVEYEAFRWAALFLISQHKLDEALLSLESVCDLADYFDVTEEFMKFRLDLNREMWVNDDTD